MAKKGYKTIQDWSRVEYLGRPAITGFIDGVRVTREVFWNSGGYIGTASHDPDGTYTYRKGYPDPSEPPWTAHPKYQAKLKWRKTA